MSALLTAPGAALSCLKKGQVAGRCLWMWRLHSEETLVVPPVSSQCREQLKGSASLQMESVLFGLLQVYRLSAELNMSSAPWAPGGQSCPYISTRRLWAHCIPVSRSQTRDWHGESLAWQRSLCVCLQFSELFGWINRRLTLDGDVCRDHVCWSDRQVLLAVVSQLDPIISCPSLPAESWP